MSVYHRAFLYIVRKKGKTVLLLLTLTILMVLLLMGTAIHRTAGKASAKLREELGGYFKIIPDYQKMTIHQQVDQALVDRVMEIEGIKMYNAMDVHYLMTGDLNLTPGRFAREGDEKAQTARFLGNTSSGFHEYFYLNIFTLIEGRHLEAEDRNKALISKTMAEENGVGIGDTFYARMTEGASGSSVPETEISFEVTGIFDEGMQTGVNEYTAECDLFSNFIFIDSTSSQMIKEQLGRTDHTAFRGGAAFFVKDPRDLEEIAASVEALDGMDWEQLKLIVNNSAYESRIEPLKRLESMTLLLAGLIAGIGAVLISLLLALWERDRIHESGVLMSFGISKGNILWQHLLECSAVFLLAFCLAAAISYLAAGRIGEQLHERTASVGEEKQVQEYKGGADAVLLEALEEEEAFVVHLEPMTAALSGLSGLVLTGICVSIAFCLVVRRGPRELLTIME